VSSSPASAPPPGEGSDLDSDDSIAQLPRSETQKSNPFATMQANTVFAPPKRKRSADVVTEIPETPLNSYLEGSHNYNYNYSGELLAGEREREILVGKFRSMKLGAPGSNGTGAGEGMEESAVLFDGDDEVRDMEMDEAEEESNPTIRWKHDHGEQEKPTFNVVPPEDEDGDVAVQMPSPPREASDARGQGPGRGSHKRLRSPPPPVEPPSPEAEEETLSDVDQQGIAYIPTPEQRHARSQRRLQQVSFALRWLRLESPID